MLFDLYENKYSSKYLVFRKYEAFKLKKYYTSIHDMPMYKWNKIYKQTSLYPLSKTESLCWRANSIFQKLSDEIVDEFGIDNNYKKLLNLELDLERYRLIMQRTGDRTNIVHIKIIQLKIDDLKGKHKDSDLHKSVFIMQQKGISKDFKTITIAEYFKAQELLQEQYKAEQTAMSKAHNKARNGRKGG